MPVSEPVRHANIPIVEYYLQGECVSTVNVELSCGEGGFQVVVHAVPVTRIGRSLPDWPQALSLAPDLEENKN